MHGVKFFAFPEGGGTSQQGSHVEGKLEKNTNVDQSVEEFVRELGNK